MYASMCVKRYFNHQDAESCKKYLSGTKLDERVIRADLDPGFEEGRQYGR
jgi:nuclear cap-binding protein subunit 2